MEREQHEIAFYFKSSRLRPNATSTFIFWKQKRSVTARSAFLEPFRFISLSMMINFTRFVEIKSFKIWLQARMELASIESFLWLFNLRLNVVSAFSTYWIWNNMHSIRQITYSFLQLRLKQASNVRSECVCCHHLVAT